MFFGAPTLSSPTGFLAGTMTALCCENRVMSASYLPICSVVGDQGKQQSDTIRRSIKRSQPTVEIIIPVQENDLSPFSVTSLALIYSKDCRPGITPAVPPECRRLLESRQVLLSVNAKIQKTARGSWKVKRIKRQKSTTWISKSWLCRHQQLEHTSHWAMPLVKESGTIVPIAQTDRQTRNRGWQMATAISFLLSNEEEVGAPGLGRGGWFHLPSPLCRPQNYFLLQQLQLWGTEEHRDIQLSFTTTQPAEPCCIQPHGSNTTPRTAWTIFNFSKPYQFEEGKL